MLDTSKIYSSNNCGDFKIVEYANWKEVHIEFLLTGFKAVTQSSHVIRGKVKDKFYPGVYGVGFFGDGETIAKKGGTHTGVYIVWSNMIARCYCPKFQKRHPSYVGVTVCDDWHNFQKFAKWFNEHHIEGFQLDKDIKQKGVKNKVYSPETCVFVSPADNVIEALAKNYKMRDPDGGIHEIYNMAAFARRNKLDKDCMTRVHCGDSGSHKGWTKA